MTREERVFFPVERTGPPGGRPARNDTSRSRPLVLFEPKRRGLDTNSNNCTTFYTLYECLYRLYFIVHPHRFKSVGSCVSPAFSLWTESAASPAQIPRSLRSLHHPPDGTLVHHHPTAACAAASALRAHAPHLAGPPSGPPDVPRSAPAESALPSSIRRFSPLDSPSASSALPACLQ